MAPCGCCELDKDARVITVGTAEMNAPRYTHFKCLIDISDDRLGHVSSDDSVSMFLSARLPEFSYSKPIAWTVAERHGIPVRNHKIVDLFFPKKGLGVSDRFLEQNAQAFWDFLVKNEKTEIDLELTARLGEVLEISPSQALAESVAFSKEQRCCVIM